MLSQKKSLKKNISLTLNILGVIIVFISLFNTYNNKKEEDNLENNEYLSMTPKKIEEINQNLSSSNAKARIEYIEAFSKISLLKDKIIYINRERHPIIELAVEKDKAIINGEATEELKKQYQSFNDMLFAPISSSDRQNYLEILSNAEYISQSKINKKFDKDFNDNFSYCQPIASREKYRNCQ